MLPCSSESAQSSAGSSRSPAHITPTPKTSNIPDLHSLVIRTACKALSAEHCDIYDGISVAPQGCNATATADIPDLHSLIPRAAHQAVRAKRSNSVDNIFVATQGLQATVVASNIPDLDRSVS
mmetsp:Transcript_59339/g.128311  ORF Transcript_59339/g.128311 Transcript_59339/m.128311 type:complete len:123 (-) Transcript_59339:241-609(-)